MNHASPASLASTAPSLWRRALPRAAFLAAIWAGLNGTETASWWLGIPFVLLATGSSLALLPPVSWRFRVGAILPFAGFFVKESLRGGWDVAWRGLRPGLLLNPGFADFVPRLPPGPARLFFCHCISLLPGTLVYALEPERIRLHALQLSAGLESDLRTIEGKVANLFGLSLRAREEVEP